MANIEIYTDGSCSPNPGNGGWGAIILAYGKETYLSGSQSNTTNNRMELTAVVEALKAIKPNQRGILYSDSSYVVNGCNEWRFNWSRRSWLKSNGRRISNADLWKQLHKLLENRKITVCWIESHVGFTWNEAADQLSKEARNNE